MYIMLKKQKKSLDGRLNTQISSTCLKIIGENGKAKSTIIITISKRERDLRPCRT